MRVNRPGATSQRVCRTVPKIRFTASSGFAAPCTDAPLGINSPSRGNLRDRVWRPGKTWRKAPHTIAGAFFASAASCHGGCAWETFGSAGFQVPGSPTCVQLPPNCLATMRGSSNLTWSFMHVYRYPLQDPRIRSPPLLIGSGISTPSLFPYPQSVHPRTETGVP